MCFFLSYFLIFVYYNNNNNNNNNNNIISFITVFAGVLFVHQPGANHAPRASVTQVHTLSTFLLLLLLLLLLLFISTCM